MRNHRRRGLTALATIASLASVSLLAAACGSDEDTKSDGKTTITVEGWRPGDEQGTIDAVKKQADAFMKDHPDIVVKPIEWEWNAETFSTQLAGNQLPTTFRVPFTDTKGLAERQQIADVTQYVNELPYAEDFNPSVLAAAQGTDGKIYGLPTDVYGVGLHYNRDLFEQAGLDPDSPPTTWDEVRSDAQAIADKTGKAGYAQMSTNNTGGWMLTTLTYALGGRMESDDGATATIDNDATAQGLQMLHDMRWTDESMGKNTNYEWAPINEAFAAGKVGMYMSGSDVYNALVTTNQVDPDSYGLAVLPLSDSPDAGILGGGSVAAVSAKATPAEQEAAVQWNDFYREAKNYDPDRAVADAEVLKASDQPIGTPTLPIFDETTWQSVQDAIKPYVNVPLDQMTSFTDGVFDQTLVPEPPAHTQEVYGILDSVVQKVLTDENADIDSLLSDANDQAQALLG
ncbi:sugar ABC transporter substrate-binding protein [Nocardioides sp. Root1257]|uniref:ABC transporter substrate-binding protein n=1 Tax=unclassified Nocardioides TaxID=2615069 RepID=UPI0006F38B6E|nr:MULTISPECIES: sugar ABC transporter substrate-binding protein [unclassified Nocardioides]KQW52874.1 sugar ABC transporter substrate-binding protein [Nocardioides sp. Root1257]KRC55562.1 sugar ABC transporter substrate-binding protein [Nocardioides sp. Root224]